MKNTSFTGGSLSSSHGSKGYESVSPLQQKVPASPNKRGNYFNHIISMIRVISKVKAYFIARGVKSALKEVDLIEKGVKKPKSLDHLLNEL